MMMILDSDLIVFVIFAHFIGDIAFQSAWQAENKGKYWYVLFSHAMIWTGVISSVLFYFGVFHIWKVLFLVFGHCIIDKWKSNKPKTPEAWKYIYPDQTFHIIQCLIVCII